MVELLMLMVLLSLCLCLSLCCRRFSSSRLGEERRAVLRHWRLPHHVLTGWFTAVGVWAELLLRPAVPRSHRGGELQARPRRKHTYKNMISHVFTFKLKSKVCHCKYFWCAICNCDWHSCYCFVLCNLFHCNLEAFIYAAFETGTNFLYTDNKEYCKVSYCIVSYRIISYRKIH